MEFYWQIISRDPQYQILFDFSRWRVPLNVSFIQIGTRQFPRILLLLIVVVWILSLLAVRFIVDANVNNANRCVWCKKKCIGKRKKIFSIFFLFALYKLLRGKQTEKRETVHKTSSFETENGKEIFIYLNDLWNGKRAQRYKRHEQIKNHFMILKWFAARVNMYFSSLFTLFFFIPVKTYLRHPLLWSD